VILNKLWWHVSHLIYAPFASISWLTLWLTQAIESGETDVINYFLWKLNKIIEVQKYVIKSLEMIYNLYSEDFIEMYVSKPSEKKRTKDIFSDFSHLYKKKNWSILEKALKIEFHENFPSSLDIILDVDYFHYLLEVLLNNALQFSSKEAKKEDYIQEDILIKYSLYSWEKRIDKVIIEVFDNGCWFPKNYLKKKNNGELFNWYINTDLIELWKKWVWEIYPWLDNLETTYGLWLPFLKQFTEKISGNFSIRQTNENDPAWYTTVVKVVLPIIYHAPEIENKKDPEIEISST
jgi:hypothetical protein